MIYDIDINKASIELLPPDKRYIGNITFIQSLLRPLQWIRDLFFGSYYQGATAPDYSAGTYNYLDQVIYAKKVYSSNIDSNTDLPTTANWTLVQDNFIGLQERILYNGLYVVMEYALNKEFGGTFRQPDNVDFSLRTKSDIYCENMPSSEVAFIVGTTEINSSSVGVNAFAYDPTQTYALNNLVYQNNKMYSCSTAITTPEAFNPTHWTFYKTIGFSMAYAYLTNFQINIPTAVLDISIAENKQSVINFVKKYIPSSLIFTVVNY